MNIIEIMQKLNTFIAPSGNEKAMLKYVKGEIDKYCEESYFDPMGNLIAVMGKEKGDKLMFSSHADTIGFIAYFIDDKGFIRVNPLGGISPRSFTGRHVRFVNGVDGALSHETETEDQKIKFCYVDIGASSKEEAEKLVPIGTAGSVVSDVFLIGPDKKQIVSPYLDNRIAVAIQMLLIEKIFEEKTNLKNEIYFVFSVQEEVGLRGAKTAAFSVDPKYGIAIDVTAVSDSPKSGMHSMKLNEGACIKVMDASIYCHNDIVNFLRDTAEKNNIKHQMEVLYAGGTDAGAIHLSRGGVYAGGVSIPTRYIHSPVESASLDDCENVLELLYESVKRGYIL